MDLDALEAAVQVGARSLLTRFLDGQVRGGGLREDAVLTRLSRAACRPDVSPADILIGLLDLWQAALQAGERDGDFLAVSDPADE